MCEDVKFNNDICSSSLTIEKDTDKDQVSKIPKNVDLKFGEIMSPHMLIVEWTEKKGWSAPKIQRYQDLKISPISSCLHYGITCFEGMKCYKTTSDKTLRLFRPDCNIARLKKSMKRLGMPGTDFEGKQLLKCIKELIRLDKDWVPYGEGYSLYIRPNVIANHQCLGLATPNSLLLYVITSPVGPYYPSGFKPIRLKSETKYVRAWTGGTGDVKVGGNYANTIKAAHIATKDGYDQVLWLFGKEKVITEVGAMNIFFVIKNSSTKRKEIITPSLTRGDVLPGVTRRSVIEITQKWGDIDVREIDLSINDVSIASKSGSLLEAFATGTAAVITPISCIEYGGLNMNIPATGEVTRKLFQSLVDIQYGNILHEWSVTID